MQGGVSAALAALPESADGGKASLPRPPKNAGLSGSWFCHESERLRMPTPGLSLVGFMEPAAAIHYLRATCIQPKQDDASLMAEWATAHARLGPPTASAGIPAILPLPPEHRDYETQVRQAWPDVFQSPNYASAQILMVEINPLLGFQFHVDADRSEHHCGGFSSPPTIDELLATCLPLAHANEPCQITQQAQSLILRSPSLNVRVTAQGMLGNFIGIAFGVNLPLVHVVGYNGRYYLHNGFHRVYGAGRAGATHIPCILRDVASAEEAGVQAGGGTFGLPLLESANPPTLAHYTEGRAYDVQLRTMNRVLHVSWSDYAIPME